MKFFNVSLTLAVLSCAIIGAFSVPSDALNEAQDVAENVVDEAKNAASQAQDSIADGVDQAKETALNTVDQIKKNAGVVAEELSDALKEPEEAINNALDNLKDVAGNIESAIKNAVGQLDDPEKALNLVSGAISTGAKLAQDIVNKGVDLIAKPVNKVVGEAGKKLNQTVLDAIDQLGAIEQCAQDNGKSVIPRDGVEQLVECVNGEIQIIESSVRNAVGAIGKAVDLFVGLPTELVGCIPKPLYFTKMLKAGACVVSVGVSTAGRALQVGAKMSSAGANIGQVLSTSISRSVFCVGDKLSTFVDKAAGAGVDVAKCLQK